MFLLLMHAFMRSAEACGGLFHEEGSLVAAEASEAILAPGDGFVDVTYRVDYQGSASEFGWVIPIPGPFQTLEDAIAEELDALAACSAPSTRVYDSSESGSQSGGCGAGPKTFSIDAVAGADTGLEIIDDGFTGTYAYVVLEATSTEGLVSWLTEHGWSLEGMDAILDTYVASGGYQFVAVELALADSGMETRELPPIRIRYAGAELRYPALMSQAAKQSSELRTRVYVLGDQAATVSGWTSEEVGDLDGRWLDGDDPESLFDDRLREIGGITPGFGLVYSNTCEVGEDGVMWVTRFEALAAPSAHTLDPVFGLDGGTDSVDLAIEVDTNEDLDDSQGCGRSSAAAMLLPFGVLSWFLRRGKRYLG